MKVPHDSVLPELREIAKQTGESDESLAISMAIYLLGFSTYIGFDKTIHFLNDDDKEHALKVLYEYAKRGKDL